MATVYRGQHRMSRAQILAVAARRRKRARIKRIVIAVASVITVLVLGAGAYYVWFTTSLNGALSKNVDANAFAALSDRDGDKPFYVLVLASDLRRTEHTEENSEKSQRTDTMLLTRVDPKNRQVTMLSIPRDTPYTLEDGSVVKINELYNIGGVEKTIEGVHKLTGLPVSHYVLLYRSDCKYIVDELGGVEVNVDTRVDYKNPVTKERTIIEPGLQVLDGTQAQAYATKRHDVEENQESHRQDKVRTLFEAVIAKVLSEPLPELPGTIVKLAQYVETDMSAEDCIQLGLEFATGSGKMTVYQGSGPSDGGIDERTGLWMCYENPQGWAEVASVVDSGGDPSKVKYN